MRRSVTTLASTKVHRLRKTGAPIVVLGTTNQLARIQVLRKQIENSRIAYVTTGTLRRNQRRWVNKTLIKTIQIGNQRFIIKIN